MKILLLHSDFIEWEPKKKALKSAKDEKKKPVKVDETLVVLTAVEKDDEKNPGQIIENTSEAILKVFRDVRAKSIVVYPYVHLSTEPSSPATAIKVLDGIARSLKKSKKKVYSAPFGWYKAFNIRVKGHPLSELSRSITVGDVSKERRLETAEHLIHQSGIKVLGKPFAALSKPGLDEYSFCSEWKNMKPVSDKVLKRIEDLANQKVSKNIPVKIEILPRDKAIKKAGKVFAEYVPRNAKELRIVTIGDLGSLLCASEHADDTGQIGKVKMLKTEKSGKDFRIYFTIEGINSEKGVSEKPKKEGKKRKEGSEFHRFLAIDKNGNEYPLDPKDWRKSPIWKKSGEDYKRLKQFVKNELDKSSDDGKKPKHIEYMKKLELVDYCPESDIGHFKWFPKGILIKDLILAFQEKIARNYGAFKIQNPLIYKTTNKSVRSLMGEFHEKDYRLKEGNDELVLRFASDPGAFPYMQKLQFSYRNLPVKEYEEAICFRKEQHGELSGLRRVRNFVMTDLHSFCADIKQTKEEYAKLCFICQDLMNNVISKGRWVMGWEIVEAFYRKHRDWIRSLIKDLGVPSFIKMMPERSHYYSLKNEYQSIEADGANSQISTVQLDVVNGERFNITYKGKDNKDHPCIIIHCSTFGSVERTLCSILENAAIDENEGKHPMLPLWLSATQIRLLPINDGLVEYCEEIADRFDKEEIRVDIDDRVESISKKVRDAEVEWIPFSIVVGDKEKTSEEFPLRARKDGKIRKMFFDEIVREIKAKTDGLPYKPLPLDRLVTKRPIFFG